MARAQQQRRPEGLALAMQSRANGVPAFELRERCTWAELENAGYPSQEIRDEGAARSSVLFWW
eukprot:10877422-Prorocentrum_lima.AAC.1